MIREKEFTKELDFYSDEEITVIIKECTKKMKSLEKTIISKLQTIVDETEPYLVNFIEISEDKIQFRVQGIKCSLKPYMKDGKLQDVTLQTGYISSDEYLLRERTYVGRQSSRKMIMAKAYLMLNEKAGESICKVIDEFFPEYKDNENVIRYSEEKLKERMLERYWEKRERVRQERIKKKHEDVKGHFLRFQNEKDRFVRCTLATKAEVANPPKTCIFYNGTILKLNPLKMVKGEDHLFCNKEDIYESPRTKYIPVIEALNWKGQRIVDMTEKDFKEMYAA